MTAFYAKARKAVHAQAITLAGWAAACLPNGLQGWEWAALALALLGGPVVYATKNAPT